MAGRLEKHWQKTTGVSLLLLPLAWVYCALTVLRRLAYVSGLKRSRRLPVPVIVVGNLTAGGTGKTPLVIWLASLLRAAGRHPGIVSRGYRGRATHWPQAVHADSDPRLVGDEPVLLARHGGCPVVVGPDRVAAARQLLAAHPCDVLLSDDGLQHLALARDIEIVVIDGARRYGNGHCLPAGPLREGLARLRSVDVRVCQGEPETGEFGMHLQGHELRQIADPAQCVPPAVFAGAPVHAVAGIGNPARFFASLRALGLDPIEHAFPDHHDFTAADLEFGDARPVIMTEKDAVKCAPFAPARFWYLPVAAVPDPALGERVLMLLEKC